MENKICDKCGKPDDCVKCGNFNVCVQCFGENPQVYGKINKLYVAKTYNVIVGGWRTVGTYATREEAQAKADGCLSYPVEIVES
jgi:hypothetical protein